MEQLTAIFADPTVMYGAVFILAILVLVGLKWFSKKTGINTDDAQQIASDVKEISEDKLKESIVKKVAKKTKPPSIGVILIILSFASLITACSLIEPVAKIVKDNVEVTWKTDKAADTIPIDSIVVKFNPIYWKEVPDTTNNEKEKNFVRGGYSVWRLKTATATRYEVQKKDTVIYFYRKK